jgi:hypothetical protein
MSAVSYRSGHEILERLGGEQLGGAQQALGEPLLVGVPEEGFQGRWFGGTP